MRVGEALRRGILAGSLLVLAGGCSGIDVPHGEDGRAEGARGGSTPIGGAGGAGANSAGGTGGTGAGGTSGMGGAAGTFLISPPTGCPDCPPASYGVTVQGDGSDLELLFTAPPVGEPMCASQPLLGSFGGCGRTALYLHACEGPNGAGACVDLTGVHATYTDRDGRVWSGTALVVRDSDPVAGTDSGVLTLELAADGDTLMVTADYLFCIAGLEVRIVC